MPELNARAYLPGPEDGIIMSPCVRCKHKIGPNVCAAFPEGIPWPIVSGENQHRKPYPNDRGIRFEEVTLQDLRPIQNP